MEMKQRFESSVYEPYCGLKDSRLRSDTIVNFNGNYFELSNNHYCYIRIEKMSKCPISYAISIRLSVDMKQS
jgi:hypothetical protein